MSTFVEEATAQNADSDSLNISANRVRADFAACRVKFRRFGTTKTLSSAQKSQAAESFGAEGKAISAAKRLIDTKNESYRALTSLKSQITRYWKDASLTFPEPGIRLIRQDRNDDFNQALSGFETELESCTRLLDEDYVELKAAARVRLGSLFDQTDYPVSLIEEFAVEWVFPNADAPYYLKRLNPEVYAEQSRLASQRLEETVAMAEQAFIEGLDQLANHLSERLSGEEDGKPKIIRNTTLTNMSTIFLQDELSMGRSSSPNCIPGFLVILYANGKWYLINIWHNNHEK